MLNDVNCIHGSVDNLVLIQMKENNKDGFTLKYKHNVHLLKCPKIRRSYSLISKRQNVVIKNYCHLLP